MDSSTTTTTTKISPFVSPNSGALLKQTIVAWSLETGLPASVHVHVDGKIFNLHKFPLVSKCGYFKKALLDSSTAELPERFPGGCEVFEMVALFCYNSNLRFDPFSIAALRCAAHVLEMTEAYDCSNLGERSDLYLNQVVLQSWDDTLFVLQKCQSLLPWAEDLLVVSRCVESLAFMACMEILDPEHKRGWPVTTLQALAGHNWSCELAKEMAGRDLWIKDLIALPFEFFKRIITSLRRQGMKEKYVSPIVVFYANKWVLSKKTHKFWEESSDGDSNEGNEDTSSRISEILQGIVELLPVGEDTSRVVPAAFYFSLLSRSMALNLSGQSWMRLQDQVASLLHLAQVEDFLLPEGRADSITSTPEFEAMERIVSIHVSTKNEAGYNSGCLSASSIVAELWDRYLSQIAMDPRLEHARFAQLIEVVPMADRETHDHLYRALNTFLLEHPHLSTEEKASVCKYLNCQKLSQEVCIEAVQNELMPLRLIVQALFVQQLQTHQAFKECSGSFRCTHYGEFSGSFSSSRGPFKLDQASDEGEPIIGPPLGSLLQKDVSAKRPEVPKEDYESTSFRLQALEDELMSLKLSLRRQNEPMGSEHITSKSESFRSVVKKRRPLGQVRSCIGLSWASQRKYASRLLKIVRRITTLGKGKSKMKKAASGLSSTSLACKRKPLHPMYNS